MEHLRHHYLGVVKNFQSQQKARDDDANEQASERKSQLKLNFSGQPNR